MARIARRKLRRERRRTAAVAETAATASRRGLRGLRIGAAEGFVVDILRRNSRNRSVRSQRSVVR